jgi:soluble lytic murein transglycosylase-like protein
MPKIKHEKRKKMIRIRVTDEEKNKMNERKTQKSLATWLRNLALDTVPAPMPITKTSPIKRADPNLVRAIGRIGSNLNQIAKYANTNKQLDDKVLSSITRIETLLISIINKNKDDSDDS